MGHRRCRWARWRANPADNTSRHAQLAGAPFYLVHAASLENERAAHTRSPAYKCLHKRRQLEVFHFSSMGRGLALLFSLNLGITWRTWNPDGQVSVTAIVRSIPVHRQRIFPIADNEILGARKTKNGASKRVALSLSSGAGGEKS